MNDNTSEHVPKNLVHKIKNASLSLKDSRVLECCCVSDVKSPGVTCTAHEVCCREVSTLTLHTKSSDVEHVQRESQRTSRTSQQSRSSTHGSETLNYRFVRIPLHAVSGVGAVSKLWTFTSSALLLLSRLEANVNVYTKLSKCQSLTAERSLSNNID